MKPNGKMNRYLTLSQKYLKDADKLLKDKDYPQASEKLWGALVTITKAVAAKRNKTIKTHEGVKFYLTNISRELKDESLNSIILIGEGLHQNFYENTDPPEAIRSGAKIIKQFVKRMQTRYDLKLS